MESETFFAKPKLVWPVTGEPFFTLELREKINKLAYSRYSVYVDETLEGTIFPQGYDNFCFLTPIKVVIEKPIITLKLVNDSDKIVSFSQIKLWDNGRAVNIFSEDGIELFAWDNVARNSGSYLVMSTLQLTLPNVQRSTCL